MSELEVEERVPETPSPIPLRSCLALQGPELEPDPSYPVGQFEVSTGEFADTIVIALAAIAELDSRVVVAVPFAAWHRTVVRRVLPQNALLKPLPLTVTLVDRASPSEDSLHYETAKVWIGILAPSAEASVVFDPEALEITTEFQFSTTDPALVPSVQSLSQAFNQHFAFVSAASEVPSES